MVADLTTRCKSLSIALMSGLLSARPLGNVVMFRRYQAESGIVNCSAAHGVWHGPGVEVRSAYEDKGDENWAARRDFRQMTRASSVRCRFMERADVPRVVELMGQGSLSLAGVSSRQLHQALCRYARRDYTDRYLGLEDGARLGFTHHLFQTYLSDLTPSEDQIFASMTSACRRAIRRSAKCGLTVEEASAQGFAEEFYEQLLDVFAKQSLKPKYSHHRVQALIDAVHPSGNLLLARVHDADGRSIATGIYPGFGRFSFFWGNGSLRQHQILRPNEALHWFAMRYWKDRGVQYHDWGGGGAYKAKYGGTPFTVPAFRKARFRFIRYARDAAERIYYRPRNLRRSRYLHSRQRR